MGIGLAGRGAEVASLRSALDRVGRGEGSVVLLRGQAGFGKTRLLEELAGMARDRGMQILTGRAWAIHVQLSYALLVDALGPYLRGLGDAERARLVDDLPELDALFVGMPRRKVAPLGDPALEKTRLFEAFCRLVERLAEKQPVLLQLDDMHWADRPSVEMLHYLCRNLRRSRIVVALGARIEEPDTAVFADMLHSLQQAGLLHVSEVGQLSHEETLEMASALLGGELAPSLQAIVSERTRGVPLMITELVRSLMSTGQLRHDLAWTASAGAAAHLPSAVRDIQRYRLSRLDAGERRVLDVVAVDGQGTRSVEIEQACEIGESEVTQRLQRLLRDFFIVADASEQYSLSHPLLQQALLDELSLSARQSLHHTLVRTLEALEIQDLGRLARHYVGAGRPAWSPRALEVVRAAAARSRSLHAHADAAQLLSAAVEIARGLGESDVLPALHAELGEAHGDDGKPGAAATSWSEAARAWQARGDGQRAAELAPKIALARSMQGRHEEALALVSATAAASPQLQVRLAEAEVIIRDQIGDVEGLAGAVVNLRRRAREAGAPELAIVAKRSEAWARMSRVECVEAWQLLDEALTAARELGDPLRLFHILRERIFVAVSLGDFVSLERDAIEARELAATQLRSAPLVSIAELGRIIVLGAHGDWPQAAQRMPPLFEAALRADDKRFAIGGLYGQAQVMARMGDPETARICLDEAKRQNTEAGSIVETRIELQRLVAEGELRLVEGDAAGAVAALEEACGPVPGRLMRTEFPVNSLERLANAYVHAKRPDDAFRIVGHLEGAGPLADAFAQRLRGMLRPGAAGVADLESALAIMRSLNVKQDVCDCCTLIAERTTGPRALELAREGIELAQRLNHRLNLQRLQARLKTLEAGAAEPVAAPPRRRAADGVSSREREVAVLVARGLTNDEIARHLDISPHTVATHLKRMYERLGFGSRVELTRYVLDNQLGD
jgi:DNA-binding CsgD family transcriptional regulator/tetratricopeptide (TPR) repeat protein